MGGIFVHHQDALVVQFGFLTLDFLRAGSFTEPDLKNETRTLAGDAFYPNTAAHHFDQLLGDRETEAGAAIFAGYLAIGLREGGKNRFLVFRRNPDTRVVDRDFEAVIGFPFGLRATREGKADCAVLGEFDGVAQQVDQDLTQPHRIAEDEARCIRTQVAGEFQTFQRDARRERFQGVADQVEQIEFDFLDIQLAGFDLGEVEDVVDHPEQVVGRSFHQVELFALLTRELGFQGQVDHAHDAVHRRADFMAHVGQEFALQAVGGFGGLARSEEFLIEVAELVFLLFGFIQRAAQFSRPAFDHQVQFGSKLAQVLIALEEILRFVFQNALGLFARTALALKTTLPDRFAHDLLLGEE